jgi:CheY-like chemotaxis protein/fructose-specific component phosphotransferase system IIB-like protein
MAKILLIDDEPGIRQIIARILEPHGYAVAIAEDGSQGIEQCRKERFDLVLSDIRPPDMDANEILAGIKALRPDLPVIILAGFGDVDSVQGLLAQGAVNYITKPFKVNDLFQMVEKALRQPAPASVPVLPSTPPPAPAPSPVASSAPPPAPRETVPAAIDAAPAPSQNLSLKKCRRFPLFIVGTLALAVVAGAGIFWGMKGQQGKGGTAYAIIEGNPSGLACDGKKVWIADWVAGTVSPYAENKAFTKVKEYTVPGVEPSGLAFQGAQLWVSHGFGHKLYRYTIGAELTAGASFDSPGPSPSGLFFDGIFLWVLDFQQAKIYKLAPASLTIVSSYDSPAANPCSIFMNGKDCYIADAATNRIFKVNPDNFVIRGVYAIGGQENRKEHLSAVGYDGEYLWVCYDATAQIYRCRLKDLKKIKS